ncbi:hypothetical protein [Sorangium sp. So ce1151]|uniref:hypothetical protein n=1 Tax=Sorangium sp. So ce1151 TaxID=3133332 RepID=UPI003F5F9336
MLENESGEIVKTTGEIRIEIMELDDTSLDEVAGGTRAQQAEATNVICINRCK